MINYEELEDAALYGIEESLDYNLDKKESGWLPTNHDEKPDIYPAHLGFSGFQGEMIAEAIYAEYMGWA